MSHLDDGHHVGSGILELGHVDGEVLELVLPRLLEDQAGPFADGIDAAQVAGGVEGWVGCLGEGHVGEAHARLAVGGGGCRGLERAIAHVWLAARPAGGDGWLGALSAEETHLCGQSWGVSDGGGGRERGLCEKSRGRSNPARAPKKARALTCWRGGQRVGGSRKSKVSASAASGCLAPQCRRATVWQRRSLADGGSSASLESLVAHNEGTTEGGNATRVWKLPVDTSGRGAKDGRVLGREWESSSVPSVMGPLKC